MGLREIMKQVPERESLRRTEQRLCHGSPALTAPDVEVEVSSDLDPEVAPPFPTAEIAAVLADLPHRPGCYLFYSRRGELLYVGKAISLRNRVRSYFHNDSNRSPKIRRLVKQITRIEWREVPTELHALTLECRLIKEEQPRFNALLKGEKRLARLRVTINEPFPRVFLDWEKPDAESLYFGPFTQRDAAEDLLDVLYRVFKMRSCELKFTGKEGLRPCLYYDLAHCLAPCNTAFCTAEEYREAVRAALDFLEGRQESLLTRLESEMEAAAEALQFERAARLRDMRAAVIRWMDRQNFMAIWSEAPEGRRHIFLVRAAQLAGYCSLAPEEIDEDSPSWRLSVMNALRETYAQPVDAPTHLGPIAIEELNILEGWLARKQASREYVGLPTGSSDSPALERMMRCVESWMGATSSPGPEHPHPPAPSPTRGEGVTDAAVVPLE